MALTEFAQHDRRSVSAVTYTEVAASAAARAFFYPSLLWNLARSRLQADWHWWDQITPTVLLGALPFESMLAELSNQGVKAVVTLNEDFEVFISSDKYKELGFDHLHLPTVDFLFAPVLSDLHRGVDFIQGHCKKGEQVYVHCKAGRGRSTTLVMCYLVRCCGMTPENALTHIQLRRPQVCLAPGQWAAILDFHASCQQRESHKAAADPDPASAPPGHCGTHSPASQLEDSASDLLEPHRKGPAASLEDSATLQHDQQHIDAVSHPTDASDSHLGIDTPSVSPTAADRPSTGKLSSSPHGDALHVCSSALHGVSTSSSPTGCPDQPAPSLSRTASVRSHCSSGSQQPSRPEQGHAADERICRAHPFVGAATITGGMACSEEAAVPLVDLQPLASMSSETWEAVSFPSSGPFGSGQPGTPSESRCQDATGFAPALRVLGWPSSLAECEMAAHGREPINHPGSQPSAKAAAVQPHAAADPPAKQAEGPNSSKPASWDAAQPDSTGSGKDAKRALQVPSCHYNDGHHRVTAAGSGSGSQLCQRLHEVGHRPAADSVASPNDGRASRLHKAPVAITGQHLSITGRPSSSAQAEGCCVPSAPAAEAKATAMAVNTLQAAGYQQIDDWATLQADGSMHDLPASSLWSW